MAKGQPQIHRYENFDEVLLPPRYCPKLRSHQARRLMRRLRREVLARTATSCWASATAEALLAVEWKRIAHRLNHQGRDRS